MARFMLSFRARPDSKPDPAVEAEWGQWMGSIGPSILDGERLARSQAMGDGAADLSTVFSAYLVIEAESFDHALSIAGGCPGLKYGGVVEVGEPVSGGSPR